MAKESGAAKPSAKNSPGRAGTKRASKKSPPKTVVSRKPTTKAVKKIDKRGTPKGKGVTKGGRGGRIGNAKFVPTDEQRIEVCAMIASGTEQYIIADILGFSVDTLQRHFRAELERGKARLLGRIGGSMFRDALDPSKPNYHDSRKYVLARVGGWKTTTASEITGRDGGPIEYRSLSDEEIEARIDALMAGHAAASSSRK